MLLLCGCGKSNDASYESGVRNDSVKEEVINSNEENVDNTKENENSIQEEKEEVFEDYDQVIQCDLKDGSYMKYYYVNYKAVRYERLFKYNSVDLAKTTQDRLIKDEGRNNVRVIGTDTLLVSDSSDPMWYVHNISQNDVYRNYENEWMEAGWICSTKDKK